MTDPLGPLLRSFAGLHARVKALETGTRTAQLGSSSLQDQTLPVFDASGALRSMIGKQVDGTYAVRYTNGQAPPMPSTPTVAARQLALVVSWDGTFANGQSLINIAPNGTFDTTTAGWFGTGAATLSWAPAGASGYAHVVATQNTTPTGITTAQLAVDGGVTYPFSAQLNPSVPATGTLSVDWFTATGTALSTSTVSAVIAAGGSWASVAGTVTSPATAARAVLRIDAGVLPIGATLDVDGVSLPPPPLGANPFADRPGDFERIDVHMSTDPLFTPDGTTVYGSLSGAGALVVPADNTVHYVRILAVTNAEVASPATPAVAVTPLAATSIAAGSIGATQLSAMIILASVIAAGNPTGLRVGMNGPAGRFEMYKADGTLAGTIDGAGVSFVDAQGTTIANASGSTLSATNLYASNDILLAGTSIKTLIAGNGAAALGVVAWGVTTSNYGPTSTEVAIGSLFFTARPGRLYAFRCSPLYCDQPLNTTYLLRMTTDGTTPTLTSGIYTTSVHDPAFQHLIGWNDTTTRTVGLLFTGNPTTGSVSYNASAAYEDAGGFRFWVEDVGPYLASTGGSAAPPRTVTTVFAAGDSWSMYGADATAVTPSSQRTHSYHNHQGDKGDGLGNQYSFYSNFPGLAAVLGAQITSVILTASNMFTQYNSGALIWWGYHGLSGVLPTVAALPGTARQQSASWGDGATASLDITAWAATVLKTGAMTGLVLGTADPGAGLAEYAYFDTNVTLTVTYTQ